MLGSHDRPPPSPRAFGDDSRRVDSYDAERILTSAEGPREEDSGMSIFDDNEPRPPPRIIVGEKLTEMSIVELQERIDALRSEIERTETALSSKHAGRAAADAVFGKR
jgi:uncharacterized small protein (DUF1192 family)